MSTTSQYTLPPVKVIVITSGLLEEEPSELSMQSSLSQEDSKNISRSLVVFVNLNV